MTTNDTSDPGVPPGEGQNPPRRPAGATFFDSVRRVGISRSDDRWIGGVAAGLGERYRLDPLLVRGLLVLSAFVGGLGLVLYAVAWMLLPERSDGRIHLEETIRGTFDVAVVGAAIMAVVGFSWSGSFWPWWGGPAEWVVALLWIAFWVAVVWLVVRLVRSRRDGTPPAPDPWSTPDAPAGSTWTPSAAAPAAPRTADPTDPPVASADRASGPTTPAAEAFTPAPRASYASAPVAPEAPTSSWTAGPQNRPGHHGSARQHGGAGVPPVPPVDPLPPVGPPPPPRPRTLRAGATSVGVVVGLSFLLGAALLAATTVTGLTAPTWAIWVGGTLLLLGAGIVVSGLRGRRGGGLTALAVVGLIVAAATWPFATTANDRWIWQWDVDWADGPQIATGSGTVIGEGQLTPRTVTEATDGYRIQFGDATLDLTELDLTAVQPGTPVVVPVEMTGGRAVIEIPDGVAVEAVVEVTAGHFEWDVDDQRLAVNGFTGGPSTYRSVEATRGDVVLLLDVDARAGDLVIQENR